MQNKCSWQEAYKGNWTVYYRCTEQILTQLEGQDLKVIQDPHIHFFQAVKEKTELNMKKLFNIKNTFLCIRWTVFFNFPFVLIYEGDGVGVFILVQFSGYFQQSAWELFSWPFSGQRSVD